MAENDAYLERDWAGAPVIESWDAEEVGKLYRSADDEATQPNIVTTFTDPARAQYPLYVHWTDHDDGLDGQVVDAGGLLTRRSAGRLR